MRDDTSERSVNKHSQVIRNNHALFQEERGMTDDKGISVLVRLFFVSVLMPETGRTIGKRVRTIAEYFIAHSRHGGYEASETLYVFVIGVFFICSSSIDGIIGRASAHRLLGGEQEHFGLSIVVVVD